MNTTNKTDNTTYSASFTTGSLLHKETVALLPLFLSDDAAELLKAEIKENKLLQINTENSRKKIIGEITKRLAQVDKEYLRFFAGRNEQEQKLFLFYLNLKVYRLLFDFHFNVTLPQWNSSLREVSPYLYQMELFKIGAQDKKVEAWTDKTRLKAISVYLRMLRDIGMLDKKNGLQAVNATPDFWQWFINNNEAWFLEAAILGSHQIRQIKENQ